MSNEKERLKNSQGSRARFSPLFAHDKADIGIFPCGAVHILLGS